MKLPGRIGTCTGLVKVPVPPVRYTSTELVLMVENLMFLVKTAVKTTCPLALGWTTVLAVGLKAATLGRTVSSWKAVRAPAFTNDWIGSVTRFDWLPDWSTTRTLAKVKREPGPSCMPLTPTLFGVSGTGLVRVILNWPWALVVPTPASSSSKTPLPWVEMSMKTV